MNNNSTNNTSTLVAIDFGASLNCTVALGIPEFYEASIEDGDKTIGTTVTSFFVALVSLVSATILSRLYCHNNTNARRRSNIVPNPYIIAYFFFTGIAYAFEGMNGIFAPIRVAGGAEWCWCCSFMTLFQFGAVIVLQLSLVPTIASSLSLLSLSSYFPVHLIAILYQTTVLLMAFVVIFCYHFLGYQEYLFYYGDFVFFGMMICYAVRVLLTTAAATTTTTTSNHYPHHNHIDKHPSRDILRLVGYFSYLVGSFVFIMLEPKCGYSAGYYDATNKCFINCPLHYPWIFNHHAIWHEIVIVAMSIQCLSETSMFLTRSNPPHNSTTTREENGHLPDTTNGRGMTEMEIELTRAQSQLQLLQQQQRQQEDWDGSTVVCSSSSGSSCSNSVPTDNNDEEAPR